MHAANRLVHASRILVTYQSSTNTMERYSTSARGPSTA
jgi:hypothetical protein